MPKAAINSAFFADLRFTSRGKSLGLNGFPVTRSAISSFSFLMTSAFSPLRHLATMFVRRSSDRGGRAPRKTASTQPEALIADRIEPLAQFGRQDPLATL